MQTPEYVYDEKLMITLPTKDVKKIQLLIDDHDKIGPEDAVSIMHWLSNAAKRSTEDKNGQCEKQIGRQVTQEITSTDPVCQCTVVFLLGTETYIGNVYVNLKYDAELECIVTLSTKGDEATKADRMCLDVPPGQEPSFGESLYNAQIRLVCDGDLQPKTIRLGDLVDERGAVGAVWVAEST